MISLSRKMLPLSLGSRGAAFSSSVFQINAEKGTKTFYVHGDILSQNSEPFKSIVDGNWEESVNREINLEEWDADTVGHMIEYLYAKDYTWQKSGKFKPVHVIVPEESPSVEHSTDTLRPLTPISGLMEYREKQRRLCQCNDQLGAVDKEETLGESFLVHAKVYALANYRAIEGLSELALDRLLHSLSVFQSTEYNIQQIGYIVELVSYVYENTCRRFGKPEPIRQAVTRFIALELTKLDSTGEISVLMSTYEDFAFDLLSDLTRRIMLAEAQIGMRYKYLAGVEVSQSYCNERDIFTFYHTLSIRAHTNEQKIHTGVSRPVNCVQESQWKSSNINFRTTAE